MTFAVCLLIVLSQKWHGKLSHDHDLSGVQKVHTAAVPRIGGIGVIAGVLLGLALFQVLAPSAIDPIHSTDIRLLLLAGLPAFLAGLIEDLTKRVSVRVRLATTAMSAVIASAALGATVTELDLWGIDSLLAFTPFAIIVTAVVVSGGSNAVNIIDGFNGLSSSTLMLIAAGLAVVAWQNNEPLVILLGALCIGASLGFFLVNYPFGKLFLGDGGAYLLGFLVAEMAVLLLVRCPRVNAWQVLAICAYPVIEVLFSIYRRKFIRKVSPGAPDALHLHTLVYRRVVFPLVPHNPRRQWRRNAAVACVIVPVVALCIAASAAVGQNAAIAMTLVAAQGILYVLVYRRLVRGRWLRKSVTPFAEVAQGGEVESASIPPMVGKPRPAMAEMEALRRVG